MEVGNLVNTLKIITRANLGNMKTVNPQKKIALLYNFLICFLDRLKTCIL